MASPIPPFSFANNPEMDPRFDQWDLVIKVKYGDTLRRIGAYVHGQLMDHNMSKLRAKIISLFKFSPDADLILTYIDEDGEVVTLVDDDELRDAVIGQHLNPLRINVQLKCNTGRSSDARSEAGSPAPAKSPQLETQPLQICSAVDEALSSVPEPLRSALSNLSNDVLKAATSAPAFAQFVEYFSKLGLSNANEPSHGPTGKSSGESSGASTHLMDLNVSDEPKASNYLILEATELPNTTTISVNPVPKQHERGNLAQGVGATASSVDFNLDVPRNPNASLYPFDDLLASVWTAKECLEPEKEGGNAHRDGKSVAAAAPASFPPTSQTLDHNSQNFGTPMHSVPIYKDGVADMMSGDSSNKQFPMNTQAPDAPISRHVGAPPPEVPAPIWSCPMIHPYRRSQSYHENTPRTFHRGVQCDGCGMHPIMGPRFKSNVKEDYDLCNICFSQMGNEADYTRIDRAAYHAPRLFNEFHNPHPRYRFPSSNAFHGCGVRPPRAKLESRFIQDVTVLDGTVMPPSTHFTKIWRMHNNGTVAWPFGTQLVWVGGDQFGDQGSADLEIPVNGFPVEGELDIAVDFTAPSRPGRYVSYWRMSSPSGQKFGQRVWVLIQVDYSRPNSASGSSFHADLNLNLPPESSGRNGLGIIDVNAEPLDGGFPEINVSGTTEELVKPAVDDVPSGRVEHPARVVDDFLDTSSGLSQPTPAAVVPPSASYPFIDFPAASSSLDASPAAATDGNPVEQTLLKELEEMGFKQIDLNKEILRLNEYDLEQSVDDLCGFAEWDPLLTELQEMGFSDKELNKKLLIKNGGSIKRAVLDLIAGERLE